jgi:hypothetical protein
VNDAAPLTDERGIFREPLQVLLYFLGSGHGFRSACLPRSAPSGC